MNWAMMAALGAAVPALGGFLIWAVRSVVREETEPIKQDVAVLRTAVFNHVAHGEEPVESHIREVLGYATPRPGERGDPGRGERD